MKLNSHIRLENICVTNINKYNGKDTPFLFKIGWSRDIKRLYLIFKWNSELLEASILKSSKETGWSHISIWSLTNADFFELNRLFVKGETPECSLTLTLKWRLVSP